MIDDKFRKAMQDELKRASCKVSLDDMKANLDMYVMASESLALYLKTFYDGFVKAGFDSVQSMYLTGQIASTLVGLQMMSSSDKP